MGVDPTTARYPGMVYKCPACVALLVCMYMVNRYSGFRKYRLSLYREKHGIQQIFDWFMFGGL